MSYDALEVSQYIIYYESTKRRTTSNLRLQKLLYFVQAQFICNTKDHRPCFINRMEAWDFGPVVPEVYREYRSYGGVVIPYDGKITWNISSSDKELINSMLDCCASYSNSDLVDRVHAQTPWRDAYYNHFNRKITPDSIYRYFVDGK